MLALFIVTTLLNLNSVLRVHRLLVVQFRMLLFCCSVTLVDYRHSDAALP